MQPEPVAIEFIRNDKLPPIFKEAATKRQDGSSFHFYINDPGSDSTARPLIVWLDGSGCNSHFFIRDGQLSNTNYGLLAGMARSWAWIAASEKRGVPFGYPGHEGSGENCPKEYTKHASRDQRVSDGVLLIKTLQGGGLVKGDILLIGHSEGAVIAAGITELLPEVSHIAFLSGNGPTQMFDFMVLARKKRKAQGRPPEAIEAEIKNLELSYQNILAEPQSTEKFFMGHSYLRWSSYFLHPALDSLLRCKAKLYLMHGTDDESVPIESFDMLAAEFIRNRRPGTVVRRVPGVGHNLRSRAAPRNQPPLQSAFEEVLGWLQQDPRSAGDGRCEAQILRYSEWPKVQNPAWQLDLASANVGRLFYFGADHSDDPASPQFKEIDRHWADVKPTTAYYEGQDRGVTASREETIRKFGESGYVRFLAKAAGIQARRLNPPPNEYLAYLLNRFPPDQVSLFLLLGEAARLRERKGASLADVETGIRTLMEKAFAIPGSERLIRDIPGLEAAYKRYWKEPADWRQAPQRWFTPGDDPKETGGIFINMINRLSSEYRDRYMVRVLSEAALQGERVFAVVGRNHVPMQAPALRCLLKGDGKEGRHLR